MWNKTALCLFKIVLYVILWLTSPWFGFLFDFLEKILDKIGI